MSSKPKSLLNVALSTIAICVVFLFAIWWFQPVHIPNNFSGPAHGFDVLIFLLVSYVVWHPIIMAVFSWTIVSNIKPPLTTPKPKRGLKVAFVTTFVPASESIELLDKCLPAMVKAYYKHDTWVLDEGNDPRVKKLCKKYGVKHFSRSGKDHYNSNDGKYAKKTKGSNHNSWYDVYGHSYDVVAQIDTDFVPNRRFLSKTLGYFKNPKIAFVGTPQIYGNMNDSLIARGAAEQTYSFYGPILRGFHGMRMNMLIGANHVVRVKALESVDHYSAHITEDLLTGMKLHANGWESTYVSEVLAVGEGPTTWQSFFSQQMRWAYGCMHILRHHSFKLFKEMTIRQKVYYLLLQQHYFSGLVMTMGVIGLAIYFAFGIDAAETSFLSFVIGYGAVMATMALMAWWMQGFHVRPKEESGLLLSGKIISAAAWPIFFIAFLGVLSNKKLSYKVTPKGNKVANHDSIKLFIPHLLLGTTALVGLLSSFVTGRDSMIMLFWASLVAVSMLLVPFSQQIISAYTKAKLSIVMHIHNAKSFVQSFSMKTLVQRLIPSSATDDK